MFRSGIIIFVIKVYVFFFILVIICFFVFKFIINENFCNKDNVEEFY